MILVDSDILGLVNGTAQAKPLIENFSRSKLSNCRYDLRAGRAFLPKSGDERVVGPGSQETHWSINPSETLIVMTKEYINMPNTLFASYSQLNRLARQGLMLINVSIVEPGYHGPLSCFLVNFSREVVHLYPDDAIAKITFHQLTSAPQFPFSLTIPEEEYRRGLARDAQAYPVSFMDIGGLEGKITDRVGKEVTNSVKIGVVLLAVLAFFSSLEPLMSKFVWEPIGIKSSQREEMLKLQSELQKTKDELAKTNDDIKSERKLLDLEDKIKAQADQIEQLRRPLNSR